MFLVNFKLNVILIVISPTINKNLLLNLIIKIYQHLIRFKEIIVFLGWTQRLKYLFLSNITASVGTLCSRSPATTYAIICLAIQLKAGVFRYILEIQSLKVEFQRTFQYYIGFVRWFLNCFLVLSDPWLFYDGVELQRSSLLDAREIRFLSRFM